MLAAKIIISVLPFVASAFAAPAPAPFDFPIANATAADADAAGGVGTDAAAAPAIDSDGRARIIICSDSNGRGQCLNWGQKGHCWDFQDDNLKAFNDAVSSIYPQDEGVLWTIYADYKCKGDSYEFSSAIPDLAAVRFNDKISAFSWRLR